MCPPRSVPARRGLCQSSAAPCRCRRRGGSSPCARGGREARAGRSRHRRRSLCPQSVSPPPSSATFQLTVEEPALDRRSNIVLVADGATGGVDEPRALLEGLQKLRVDEPARALMQGAVDRDHVALSSDKPLPCPPRQTQLTHLRDEFLWRRSLISTRPYTRRDPTECLP